MSEQAPGWRPIKTFRGPDLREVDVWMKIHASPRSFGMSDAFRVVDAFRVGGEWFHYQDGERKQLYAAYITHWMPTPKAPPKRRRKPR